MTSLEVLALISAVLSIVFSIFSGIYLLAHIASNQNVNRVQATATAQAQAQVQAQANATATAQAQANATAVLIVNLPPSAVDIVTDTPPSMQLNQSYILKVSLVPKGQTFISTLTIEKATATTSEATPVGTPGTTLENAFGPGYEPFATATLSPGAGPFAIIPIQPIEQTLRQQQVVWKWSIIPQEVGTDFLDVDVEITWKSANGNRLGPFRLGDKQFSIVVSEPSVSVVPFKIDIGAIINNLLPYLLGTGGVGLLALLFHQVRKRLTGKKAPAPRPKKNSSKRHRH